MPKKPEKLRSANGIARRGPDTPGSPRWTIFNRDGLNVMVTFKGTASAPGGLRSEGLFLDVIWIFRKGFLNRRVLVFFQVQERAS
jgi:hypothetical protein